LTLIKVPPSLARVQMTHQQYNITPPGVKIMHDKHRMGMENAFRDPATQLAVKADSFIIEHYTTLIETVERQAQKLARVKTENKLYLSLLQTIPDIGPVLSRTILFEVGDINRFPTVQSFALMQDW
jgi:transposase